MKVLQIAGYPTQKPRFGGQFRIFQLRRKLEELGCKVRAISISFGIDPNYDPLNDYIISLLHKGVLGSSPDYFDLSSSALCVSDKRIFNFIKNHIVKFSPDIIFFEGPWLWPAIKKLLDLKILQKGKMQLVYSSQNIESSTKEQLLKNRGVVFQERERIKQAIFDLETELVSEADVTICVTESDAEFLSKYAEGKQIVVAPNGVAKYILSKQIDQQLIDWLKTNKYITFAASSYLPNVEGFLEMMGSSLARFSPEHKILLVGSGAEAILAAFTQRKDMFLEVNKTVIKNLGVVSEEVLAAALYYSQGILLPITFGSGSNLKTAEAIAACKPVVATTIACRGFNFVNQLSHFYIQDEPDGFANTANDIVSGKKKWNPISETEIKLREQVYWENTLAPLADLIERVQINLVRAQAA